MTKTADDWLEILQSPDPEPLQVGDEIEFHKADGSRWWTVIVGYDEDAAEVELLCWSGRPIFVRVSIDLLIGLRIVRIERGIGHTEIELYRALAEGMAA